MKPSDIFQNRSYENEKGDEVRRVTFCGDILVYYNVTRPFPPLGVPQERNVRMRLQDFAKWAKRRAGSKHRNERGQR